MHGNNVAEAHPQVLAHNFVHADLPFFAEFVSQNDAHGIFALLALDEHGIAAKQLELVHLLKVEGHDAVVIVHSFVCGIRKRRKDNVLFFTSDLALDLKVAQTSMNGGLEEAGGTIFGETTNITHPRQVCWETSCAPGSANGGESRGSTYCFIRQLYAEWCCVFGR